MPATKIWASALFVAGLACCRGRDLEPTVPAPTVLGPTKPTKRCRDWVNDASDGVRWELERDEDDIRSFVGTVPNSDFVAFKGAGTIDAPIARVANALIDTTNHSEWIPRFGGGGVVRQVSETEQIIYRHVITPFIVSDRDFVVRSGIRKEEPSGHLLIEFSSVEDRDVPVADDKIRGVIHASGYRMWPIDGGAGTMMIFTIHVDPKGSMPAWIVNLFQKGYARANLQNIRRYLANGGIEEHPRIKAAYVDFEPCVEAGPR